jgi:hypothetical protein
VQRTTSLSSRSAAKAILVGLLAVLLVVAASISVSHALHQSLHDNGKAGHLCLVCMLVKGQVSAADVPVVFTVFLATLFFFAPLVSAAKFAVVDRRLSPGRAPPCLPSCF